MLSFRNSTDQDICIHQQKMKYKTTNTERPGIYCLGSKIYLDFLKPYGHPGYNPWGMNYITQNQYGGGRVGIIFEKIRVLLFIEPTEAFINKIDNIKIEFIWTLLKLDLTQFTNQINAYSTYKSMKSLKRIKLLINWTKKRRIVLFINS